MAAKKPSPKKSQQRAKQVKKAINQTSINSLLEVAQNTKRLIWLNFLIGTMRGLGFLIGTMVVVALLVWVFKLLGGLPLIGNWVLMIIDFIKENADLSVIPSAPLGEAQGTAVSPGLAEKFLEISN